MSETLLASFVQHWEAELARGYLEDAGVPSRLISDNLAGGHTYMGGLSGASLLVAAERAEEAYQVLASAGLVAPVGDDGPTPASPPLPLPPAERAERDDILEALAAARKAETRHALWCMLGVTPAAVIPLVGLALEGNVALMAVLCGLVVLVEGWRWVAASRKVRGLEVALADVEERARFGPAGES